MIDVVLVALGISLAGAIGALQVIGSLLGWRCFVDPPEEWGPIWPYSEMKRQFGQTGLLVVNYLSGSLMLVGSILIMVLWLRGGAQIDRGITGTVGVPSVSQPIPCGGLRSALPVLLPVWVVGNIAILGIRWSLGKPSRHNAIVYASMLIMGLFQLAWLLVFAYTRR